jgi:hypothetical protein
MRQQPDELLKNPEEKKWYNRYAIMLGFNAVLVILFCIIKALFNSALT